MAFSVLKGFLPRMFLLMACVQAYANGEETICNPKSKSACNLVDYFFGIGEPYKTLNVTWAHAVNSQQLLEEGLTGNVMMLEADISLGTTPGSKDVKPIMAHPPTNTSDLSFGEFIFQVVNATANGAKKGIKLDFKSIDVVEPALKMMQRYAKSITFPVMLNADVLSGPVNSTTTPVNGNQFLRLAKKYFPGAILSLGWTTKFDCKNLGEYERQHFQAMKQLIHDNGGISGDQLTFPVRAGMIAESAEDHVLDLLATFPRSTYTLWASKGDPLDGDNLHNFLKIAGSNKVYADLPFVLDSPDTSACSSSTGGDNSAGSMLRRPSAAVLMLLIYAGFRRYV